MNAEYLSVRISNEAETSKVISCRKEENKVREDRVQILIRRREQNLDLWTGENLFRRNDKINCINVIRPYKYSGMWVFDDENVGLYREAFVAGADVMIDVATQHLENPEKGFTLVFSEKQFPTANIILDWLGEQDGGNVYIWQEKKVKGWLCPALFNYFDKAPQNLFIEIKK